MELAVVVGMAVKVGAACINGSCVEGGISYGNAKLPCELGSGSGNDISAGSTAGGGIIVMGSVEHPLSMEVLGVGSGGTILLFLRTLALGESANLSSVGGYGSSNGAGGGGGGRIHFHWSDIPTGDVYQPIASVGGSILARGGVRRDQGGDGENGTVTGKACPKGLYGTFCEECPAGTYKNALGLMGHFVNSVLLMNFPNVLSIFMSEVVFLRRLVLMNAFQTDFTCQTVIRLSKS
ncbi:hypothetical protein M0R45_012050 [Rubus argutus]|uniref:DUF8003 domain-containing protein n=1 Tax=Rubus argutus TaxID=59490 RepID=A0AAW1YC24_RUBAR